MLRVIGVGVGRARVDVVCVAQHTMSINTQQKKDELNNCTYDDKSIVQTV